MRDLFKEMFVREKQDEGKVQSILISNDIIASSLIADAQQGIQTEHVVDCNVNRLAKANRESCSDAVRAVANFFLDTDNFKDICDDRN